MDPRPLLELALRAADIAGAALLDRFYGPARGVTSKTSPTDLVSEADHEAEALILELIRSERSDDGILAEEGGASQSTSGLRWVIDPLDGTVNYLFGIAQWAVSIAVEDEKGALAGVVHHPVLKETFTATRGGGAFMNGDPIKVSERPDVASALIGTGFSYEAEARAEQATIVHRILPRVRDIRRSGSAALDLAAVACGRLDGMYEAPMEAWDKAAGVLLIEEAGGTVSEFTAPLGLTPGVIAANPVLHEQLRRMVLNG